MTKTSTPSIPPHLDRATQAALAVALSRARHRARAENRVVFVRAGTLELVVADSIRVAAYHVYPGGKVIYHAPPPRPRRNGTVDR